LTAFGATGVTLVAAACGGASAPPAAAPTTSAAANSAAGGAAPAAKQSLNGSITYFDTDDDPASSAWHDKYHSDFVALYPDVKIEAAHYASADYNTKLATALATGAHLDMLFWDTTNVPLLYTEKFSRPMNGPLRVSVLSLYKLSEIP
jgi:ABC-type glycerol-3-phosphate transport system substrate-binding protein